MPKRSLRAAIVAATLLACTAIVPVFATGLSPSGTVVAQDKMQDDKMKQDKMASDKMAGNRMSSMRHKHRRRHRKHKMGGAMDKMQGNKRM